MFTNIGAWGFMSGVRRVRSSVYVLGYNGKMCVRILVCVSVYGAGLSVHRSVMVCVCMYQCVCVSVWMCGCVCVGGCLHSDEFLCVKLSVERWAFKFNV